jgi:hypothetical protein
MKLRPFPLKDLFSRARLLPSVLLAGASLLLGISIFSFFLDGGLPTEALIIPALILTWSSIWLTIQLRHKTIFPLNKFIRQIKETHPDFLDGRRTGDKLSFLQRYAGYIDEKLKRWEDESRRLRRGLVALSAITAAMDQDTDIDQVLTEVLGTIIDVTGFDAGIVFLHKMQEEDGWDVRAWRGMQLEDMWGADQVKVGEEILHEAAKSQRTIFISDSRENQKWDFDAPLDSKRQGLRRGYVDEFLAQGNQLG